MQHIRNTTWRSMMIDIDFLKDFNLTEKQKESLVESFMELEWEEDEEVGRR